MRTAPSLGKAVLQALDTARVLPAMARGEVEILAGMGGSFALAASCAIACLDLDASEPTFTRCSLSVENAVTFLYYNPLNNALLAVPHSTENRRHSTTGELPPSLAILLVRNP